MHELAFYIGSSKTALVDEATEHKIKLKIFHMTGSRITIVSRQYYTINQFTEE